MVPAAIRERSSSPSTDVIAESTVVKPASRNPCISSAAPLASHAAVSAGIGWRCASMKPGITVLPRASIRRTPGTAAGRPAETDAILPPRTTTAPRSITAPVPSRIRAFVMTRFCAAAGAARVPHRAMTAVNCFMLNLDEKRSLSVALPQSPCAS